MKVKVLYFASIKERLGKESEEFEIAEGAKIETLINQIKTENENAKSLEIRSFLFAVNQEIVKSDTILKPDDEIAILPPLSGG